MAKLAQAQVTTDITAVYTVPVTEVTLLQSFEVTNDTSGDIAFSLWLVPGGSEPTSGNSLYENYNIKAGDKLDYAAAQVLGNTLEIQVQGSKPGLSIVINGVENTQLPS